MKITLLILAAAALMAGTIFGAIWVSHIESNKAAADYPKCVGKHTAHTVVIKDNKAVPAHTNARRCDTLTITNLDDADREMAFGPHDRHVAYDGVSERYLSYKGTFSVTLVQPGNFRFHDHIGDIVQGTFTVTQ